MDKRKLRTLAVVLYSVATTFIPLLAVFSPRSPEDTPASQNACELTEAQVLTIRAAMFGSNSSCSYENVTIGSALLGD